MDSDRATVWEHLDELRQLAIRLLATVFIGFSLCFMGYKPLFDSLLAPLDKPAQLQVSTVKEIRNSGVSPATYFYEGRNVILEPGESLKVTIPDKNQQLVILSPLEGMTTMLKLCFWTSLVVTSPIWLYFIFIFISPALGKQSRKLIIPFTLLLLIFGSCGFLFAYLLTIPIANVFLSAFNSEIGLNFWSLAHYVDYSILLLLSHAFIFELAALLLILVHYGIISYEALRTKRRHACLISFIIAAILTPPDIFTQIALGIPMVIMYELIMIYGRLRAEKSEYSVIIP